jgi:tetratricopeptide (TPR) repeat protein
MAEMAGKKGVEKISEIDDNRAIDLETVALTNIATCYLKLGEPRKALEFSQKALETNNNAWKASLRKSESHTMMLNFVLARAALEEALAIAPDSGSKAAVKKEKDRMIALERATTISDNQKQKKAFAKMFSENNKDSVSTPSVVPENSGSSSSSSSIDKNLKANSSS